MNNDVSPGKALSNVYPHSRSNTIHQHHAAHYTRLLRRWPIDRLRPEERTFQRLLQNRIHNPPQDTAAAERECNAAYLLLDNALSKRFPLGQKVLKPVSDPEHYVRIGREVEELPDRGFVGRMMKKLQGMVRMQ